MKVWSEWNESSPGKMCMYPAEGSDSPRKMHRWEIIYCPWYMETTKWSVTFRDTEKQSLQQIKRGQEPNDLLHETKFVAENAMDSAEAMEKLLGNIVISIDKSRKSKTKVKAQAKPKALDTSLLSGKSKYLSHTLLTSPLVILACPSASIILTSSLWGPRSLK